VIDARNRQTERYRAIRKRTLTRNDAQDDPQILRDTPEGEKLLETAITRLGLSRGHTTAF